MLQRKIFAVPRGSGHVRVLTFFVSDTIIGKVWTAIRRRFFFWV